MVARGGAQLAWKKIYPQVEQGPVQGGHGCSEWLVKYPGSKIGYCLRLEKLRSDNLKLKQIVILVGPSGRKGRRRVASAGPVQFWYRTDRRRPEESSELPRVEGRTTAGNGHDHRARNSVHCCCRLSWGSTFHLTFYPEAPTPTNLHPQIVVFVGTLRGEF